MEPEIKTVSANKGTYRIGFWSAILMAIFAAAALGIGIATPPHSGPSCLSDCITYPYANAAVFFPRDYFWMIPGIFMTPLFAVLMACIHNSARDDKKVFSQIGLSFALISSAVNTFDYFIQLTVMQPSLLNGEMDGLALFSQYNPHGIFIALEDLGYLMMSAAFMFAAGAFTSPGGLERSIPILFIISSLIGFAAFIGLSLVYGYDLGYRFEVTIISINWLTLIVSGVLLGIHFRRAERSDL